MYMYIDCVGKKARKDLWKSLGFKKKSIAAIATPAPAIATPAPAIATPAPAIATPAPALALAEGAATSASALQA